MGTKRTKGPLHVDDRARLVALGLTDDDIVCFEDLLLCAPRRRTREVLLTFIRFIVRRRTRQILSLNRAESADLKKAVASAVEGHLGDRCQRTTEESLLALDRAINAVGEGERRPELERAASVEDVLYGPKRPSFQESPET